MTYVEEERVLLSSDAFGQHVASSERFDRDASFDPVEDAKIYYANILMPFSPLVQGLLKKVPELNLKPEVIAPDHGIIWTDPGKIIEAYDRWSRFEAKPKVVIAYDTMWGSTEKMAHILADGLADDHGFTICQGDHLGRVRRHRQLRWPQYHFEFHIHCHSIFS